MNIYKPYFYIIQHKPTDMFYVGAKWAQDANPENFMTENGYHTSSGTIISIIEEQGLDSFIIRKIRTFETGEEAYDYETRFLQKVDARNNPMFYNGHNNDILFSYHDKRYKEMMLKLYGVEYASQSEEIRGKIKQTCMKKYGVENVSQSDEVKEKTKQTNLEKYGTPYGLMSDEVKNKRRQTNLEKYGVDNVRKSKEIQEKLKNTWLDRYGVENPAYSREIKDKISKSNSNRIRITNGIKNRRIKHFEEIPEGWYMGETRNKLFTKIWITNGIKSIMIREDDMIPEGWSKGRVLK